MTFRDLVLIRDEIADRYDQPLTLKWMASQVHYSPSSVQRHFYRAFGESPHAFVSRLRLRNAQELLADGHHSVTEVCALVGFSSVPTFCRWFQHHLGVTPTEFQQRVRRFFPSTRVAAPIWVPGCVLRHLQNRIIIPASAPDMIRA